MISNQPGIQDILPKDHLLSKLYSEHAVIKSVLDSMESGSVSLLKTENFEQAKSVLQALGKGVKNLLNAEPHHQREEEILFPMMESQGVNGPPSVMRSEHETLREGKHHLKNLLADESVGDFSAFR
ncbi:MAG: hemerythrin domain-containing protein [Candidatus Marinimicrobia bacterium]|nr:hemerythrin domain-containing protein [Candidatus Neomarinimicrobiota bacterium]